MTAFVGVRNMEIKCPHHNKALELKVETLCLFGRQMRVVTGKCNECKQIYINERLFSSTNSFTVNAVEYEYYDPLNCAEVPKELEPKPSINEKKLYVPYTKKQNDLKREKAQREECLKKERTEKLLQQKKQDKQDGIDQVKSRILNNSYKEYRVKNVYYQNSAKVCKIDGDELLKVERVSFKIEGTKFKASGMCCLRCNSVYLPERMRDKITLELEKAKNRYNSRQTYGVSKQVKKPSKNENQKTIEKTFANKEGPEPVCVHCLPHIPTEITTATLKNKKGIEYKITIVEDETYQKSEDNIYWQDRSISRAVFRAISTGKPWVCYNSEECQVMTYSQTNLLSVMLGAKSDSNNISSANIWIYKAKSPCPSHIDQVEAVTAYVTSVQDNMRHPINVSYCRKCKKYFINTTSFNIYSKKYGMPLIKLSTPGEGSFGDYASWREESVLHFLGYNVNSQDNLSEAERQRILTQSMEAGYISKPKIISFLETMIKLNEGQDRKANAVFKWKKDLKYVLDYKIDKQRKVYGMFFEH